MINFIRNLKNYHFKIKKKSKLVKSKVCCVYPRQSTVPWINKAPRNWAKLTNRGMDVCGGAQKEYRIQKKRKTEWREKNIGYKWSNHERTPNPAVSFNFIGYLPEIFVFFLLAPWEVSNFAPDAWALVVGIDCERLLNLLHFVVLFNNKLMLLNFIC